MTDSPAFSVIIPAFQEEAVIARCLTTLTRDAPGSDGLEVIVIANGCSDATAAIARASAPAAWVIEIDEASKTAAINAGLAMASHDARIVLDADVECGFATVQALAKAVGEPSVLVASPAIRIDASRCDRWVKAYYRVWSRQPYALTGNGGAGCYALSRETSERIGAFPPIVGDDIWFHTRIPPERKRLVARANDQPVETIVRPPRTAREHIAVEARRQNGNRVVMRDHPSEYYPFAKNGGAMSQAIRSGAALPDIAIYFAMKFAARALAIWQRLRGRADRWTRDEGSRLA